MPDKDKFRLAPYPATSSLDDTDYMLLENAGGEDSKISGSDLKTVFAGVSEVVDDTSPQLGGDLDLNGFNLDFPTTPNIADVLDEDTMSSDSAVALATQQSIKAYVDAQVDHVSVATGTVTSGQVLALNGTPIELIAAPAANKALVIEEIQLFLDYGGATYSADAGEDLTIAYSGGTGVAVIDNDAVTFLEAGADAHWMGKNFVVYDAGVAGTGDGVLMSGFDAEALQMSIAVGEVITGSSDIKYSIRYRTVDYLT